jgi:hypothetical protein
MKTLADEDVIKWDLRLHRSLKGLFASAACYLESRIAHAGQNWTSYYFLLYYSLFHAFLSNVLLAPEEEFNKTCLDADH